MAAPTTALQDAVALLTVSMHAGGEELDQLVAEFQAKGRTDELLVAVVLLCRSLCFTTARLVHALDGELTDEQIVELTEIEAREAALEVLRAYARSVPMADERPAS